MRRWGRAIGWGVVMVSGGFRRNNRSAATIIGWLIGGFVVITFALGGIIVWMKGAGFLRPEFLLPMLVIGSVIVLMVGLAGTAIIFKRLELQDSTAAMGLPEGSIRAIIALMLIVIFAVISVFLISDGSSSQRHVLEGITAAQADAYPPSQVVSRTLMSGDASAPSARYRVALNVEDKAAGDMEQQLLTTLGTLVVAVAAFYFGSQAVAATQRQRPPEEATEVQEETPPAPGPPDQSRANDVVKAQERDKPNGAGSMAPSQSPKARRPWIRLGSIRLKVSHHPSSTPSDKSRQSAVSSSD